MCAIRFGLNSILISLRNWRFFHGFRVVFELGDSVVPVQELILQERPVIAEKFGAIRTVGYIITRIKALIPNGSAQVAKFEELSWSIRGNHKRIDF